MPEIAPDRRTMLYWLARACRELREAADVKPGDVAAVVRIDTGTVYRFEKAERLPHKIDQLIAAYAYLCGIDDGREIWQTAVEDWMTKGGAPFLGEPTGPALAVRLALEAHQMTAQDAHRRHQKKRRHADESREEPTSKDERREAG